MTKSDTNKPKPQKSKKLMLVRYGKMGFLGWFEHNEPHLPKTDTRVIIKTARGLELGTLVGPQCYKGGHFRSSCQEVKEYYKDAPKDYPLAGNGTFARFAKPEDIREEEHLQISALEEKKQCEKLVKKMGLKMRIVEVEHLFGGERIVMYFTSEGRVDFRELVRDLAREYQTRIELRQIGARDEARLIGDYESCGQECCCKRFLKILAPVNMRMAKTQKATLDPSKISGHCGRLKCCLRYEDSTYRELKKKLPNKNSYVKTPDNMGRVVDSQILTQLVVVQDKMGKREAVPVDEIEIITEKQYLEETKPAAPEKRRGGSRRPQGEKARPEKKAEPKKEGQTKDQKEQTKPLQQQEDGKPAAKKKRRRRRRRPRGGGGGGGAKKE